MTMTVTRTALLSLALSAFLSAPAGAAIIQLTANVDGAQANSGNGTGSSGIGTIDLNLDDVTFEVSWSGSFSGLTQPFTIAHFHGPAAANESAGVIFGTDVVLDAGDLSGTSAGTSTLSPTQAAELTAGLWYWNVHSSFAPGGELRGNISVIPEPGPALLMLMGLAGLAGYRP